MENEIIYIKLDDIIPNRFQPREVFEESALQKLADSIRQHGVIEPIIVRPISNKYEIIAGERRYKASVLAGLTKIPAIVKPMDDKESSIVAYIENEHRSDVSAIEEARTIDRILKSNDMTQEELAKEIGINQSTLANKLRLLSLPSVIQDALMHNEISERHARSLLSVKDEAKQIELLEKIKKSKMSVRELDSEIKSMNNNVNENLNNDFVGFNPSANVNVFNQPSVNVTPTNDYSSSFSTNPAPVSNMFDNPLPTDSGSTTGGMTSFNPFNNPRPADSGFGPLPSIDNTPINNPVPDFDQYLNNPAAETPISEAPASSAFDTPTTNEEPSTASDSGFMSFLNDYKTDTPVSPVETSSSQPATSVDNGLPNYFDNFNTTSPVAETPISEAPASSAFDTPTTNEEPSTSSDPGFMNFLNNFDNNNPLPQDTLPEDNGGESGGAGLNMGDYLNTPKLTPSYESSFDSTPNNVTFNDITPPITTPADVNSYVEDSDRFVDVSKATVLSSVDEIIDKLKVVVNEIKTTSKYKIDTDEINYDDIYQITIRIDKRDF